MPRIVLFGDSITQGGWSAGDGPGTYAVRVMLLLFSFLLAVRFRCYFVFSVSYHLFHYISLQVGLHCWQNVT